MALAIITHESWYAIKQTNLKNYLISKFRMIIYICKI